MKRLAMFATTGLASLAFAGEPSEAYLAQIDDWRDGRMQRLKAADGYLNLSGLFWLKEGESSFGSLADNSLL